MLTLTLPRVAALVSLSLFAAACSDTASTAAVDASATAEQTLIIDTHIDIPFRLHRGYVDVSQATDGVGDSLPIGLKDASTYGDLMEGLRGRGYSQADINKIMGGNTLRVWQAVEAYAAQMGNPTVCAG